MEFFRPSKKILEKICTKEPLVIYETYTRQNYTIDNEKMTLSICSLDSKICEYYKIYYDINERKRLHPMWLPVIGECIKNCFDHGPENKEINLGLFLGDKGVCCGFHDGGDYFKNKKIKSQYEHKRKITKFDKKTFKINCQWGVNGIIFKYSDLIEVDTTLGILYCVKLKKNLIAPEGKIAGIYFKKELLELK